MNQDNNLSLIAEATDINTPPDRLRELASHPDYASADLGVYLVSNPNSPLDILLKLGEKYPEQLLSNNAFDLHLLVNPNLLAEMPENTLLRLLKLPQFPQECVLLILRNRVSSQKILITIFSIARELVNQWTRDNNITLNFQNADLSRVDLSRVDLSRVDLSGANLWGANLSYANLSHANLSHAGLSHANLSGTNLSGTYLSGTYLGNANLSGANLIGANLIGTNLKDAKLDENTQIDRKWIPG